MRKSNSNPVNPVNCAIIPTVDLRVVASDDVTSESLVVNEHCELTCAPLFVAFHELVPVYELINKLRLAGSFSIGGMKRAIKKDRGYFRKLIKLAVASIGLDPSKFSGHSLRSGGATDLFEARVPYHIIKKMGRWKSDAAMRYYRSEEDVLKAVRKAFNRMCKKVYKI